jgi:hypothetical protein
MQSWNCHAGLHAVIFQIHTQIIGLFLSLLNPSVKSRTHCFIGKDKRQSQKPAVMLHTVIPATQEVEEGFWSSATVQDPPEK